MKKSLLTVTLAAFALVSAFSPTRSEAMWVAPTWEKVGVDYGYYLWYGYEYSLSGNSGLADYLTNSLINDYGTNVAYYFYFEATAQDIYDSIYYEANFVTQYYYYLASFYGYLYYWAPAYAQQLQSYFWGEGSSLWAQYESYALSQTIYYWNVSDFYYNIIFP